MRKLGHKIPPERLKHTQSLYISSQKEMEPTRQTHIDNQNAEYFKYMLEESLTGAALGWAFDAPPKEVVEILKKGVQEAPYITKFRAPFDPGYFRTFLGAALVAQVPKVTPWMLNLPRKFYTSQDTQYSEAAFLLIEAMQSGGKSEKGFPGLVKKLAGSVKPKELIVNPRDEKAFFDPLVMLLEAIVGKDQAAFDKAWSKEEEAWRKVHSRPARSGSSTGVLDLVALGIGRIAQLNGLKVPATNPYAPLELLQIKP
jgi:hypothetical protein